MRASPVDLPFGGRPGKVLRPTMGPEPPAPPVARFDGQILRRAAVRWAVVCVVFALAAALYYDHPYYRRPFFGPWRAIFACLAVVWLAVGLPYCALVLRRFPRMATMVRDPVLHLLVLVRAYRARRFLRTIRKPRIRTTVLGLVVKGYFGPLMSAFIAGHTTNIGRVLARNHGVIMPPNDLISRSFGEWWSAMVDLVPRLVPTLAEISALFVPATWTLEATKVRFDVYYDLLFFVDCGVALFGYCVESRLLGNKTKSVEPTGLGWAAALACYPPFNDVTGTYLPLDGGKMLFTSETALLVCRGFVLLAFTIYVAATVAFGPRFSNLTNRGIITRGPYRFVRHPAYAAKCFAWWLEHLPTLTPKTAFFLCGLNAVYALRAWTEERHLSADPAYRAYKAKVRWRIFPGLF